MIKTRHNSLVMKAKAVQIVTAVLRTVVIIGLCYLFLFPLFYLIIRAFQDPVSSMDPMVVWIPKKLSLENMRYAVEMLHYGDSFLLSLSITLCSTAATLISCSLVGYGFARFQFFSRRLGFALVILTIIVPPQTILVSSYLNYTYFDLFGLLRLLSPLTGTASIDLIKGPLPFVLPALFGCGLRSGLFIFIFRQFFMGQPKELEEAARIDGCGALRTFLRIMAPLAVPAFITVFLFSIVWHWNDFYSSSIYYSMAESRPLTVMLNTMIESLQSQISGGVSHTPAEVLGALAAGCLSLILPLLIIYAFTQKYFTESVERAGIVG